MIGNTPQSFSHINFAASAKLSVSQIAFAFGVITSFTFMIASPSTQGTLPRSNCLPLHTLLLKMSNERAAANVRRSQEKQIESSSVDA
jgi:hypothetical protein